MLVQVNLIPIGKVIPMKLPDGTIAKVSRRPGEKMDWDTITVHNVGNADSTPKGERGWLVNQTNLRVASWHYCLRHDMCVQAIPDDEVAYHSATWKGNHTSLSVEISESGDFELTIKEAAKWIAEKLHSKGYNEEHVTTHQRWSGKVCPWKLLPRWEEFIAMIKKELEELDKSKLPAWKEEIIVQAHELGLVNDLRHWLEEADEPMPAWAVLAVAVNLKKGGK